MRITYNPVEIGEGRTDLTVIHNKEDLTFIHPYFGRGTYTEIAEKITGAELRRPSFSQVVSLIHSAFSVTEKDNEKARKYSQEIKHEMLTKFFLGVYRSPICSKRRSLF